MSVSSLAYVGLGVSDVEAWRRYAVDVLGLQDEGETPGGGRAFRIDDCSWRVALVPSQADDLLYAGFSVEDDGALSALAASFERSGVTPRWMEPADAARRKVGRGFVVPDPDGLPVEVVRGLKPAERPFRSPLDAQFITEGQGLGHMVITAPDIVRSLDFYERLGFEVSDYITVDLGPFKDVRLVFLHCNARHHTLALLPLAMPKRLNHLMFEVNSIDTVIQAYYRAQSAGTPIVRHLGRHTNDQMLSFYSASPAGFDVEYGFGGIRIEGSWKTVNYNAISLWGHQP